MSWSEKVAGGVGPPRLALLGPGGRVIKQLTFPADAALEETFDAVVARAVAVTGGVVEVPRGFRYRARVRFAFMEVGVWRDVAGVFAAWRAGATLRFWPHADCDAIFYDVVPEGDFAFPYVAGKMVGYAGTLTLIGKELLPYIPAPAAFHYFCDAEEEGYAEAEITHFTSAAEENYATAEESFFSPVEAVG